MEREQIKVLSDGAVAEMGTPEDLMKHNGTFTRMVKTPDRKPELDVDIINDAAKNCQVERIRRQDS